MKKCIGSYTKTTVKNLNSAIQSPVIPKSELLERRFIEIEEMVTSPNIKIQKFIEPKLLDVISPSIYKKASLIFFKRLLVDLFSNNQRNLFDALIYFRMFVKQKLTLTPHNTIILDGFKSSFELGKTITSEIDKNLAGGEKGNDFAVESLKNYLKKRDGVEIPVEDICIAGSAKQSILQLFECLHESNKTAVMLPNPKLVDVENMARFMDYQIYHYDLDENDGWSLDTRALKEILSKIVETNVQEITLVVENPHRLTSNIMTEPEIANLFNTLKDVRINIIVNETGCEDTYNANKWLSFSKHKEFLNDHKNIRMAIVTDLGLNGVGDYGIKSSFIQFFNFNEEVKGKFYRLLQGNGLNLPGHVFTYFYAQFMTGELKSKIHDTVYNALEQEYNSAKLQNEFRALGCKKFIDETPGLFIHDIKSGPYILARIDLPKNFVKEAEAKAIKPDEYFCLKLLEHQGYVIQPGHLFVSNADNYYLKMQILPFEHKEFLKIWNNITYFYESCVCNP